jgi:PAS domain S-box-containing protein
MADFVRAFDWATNTLGPIESWPAELTTLTQVILGANGPMFIVWGEGRKLIYNDAYAAVLADKHPALGQDFLSVWQEIRTDLEPLVAMAYDGVPTAQDDIPLLMHRRGYPESTHWRFAYTPVRLPDGHVGGFLCSCEEITARVLADRRLAESEARLRSVLSNTDEAFTLFDSDFTIVEVNDAACQLVGLSREELLGRSHWDRFPGTFNSPLGVMYREVLADGRPRHLEHDYGFADGRRMWLEARVFKTGDGVAVLFRDITRHRELYAQATLAADRLQVAVDVAQLGTWELDLDSDEVVADLRCRELCGLDLDRVDLSMADLRARIHPDDRPRVEHLLQQAAGDRASGVFSDVWRWRHPDGRIIWTAARGAIRASAAAEAPRSAKLIGSLLDITDLRSLEAIRQERETRLSLAMQVAGLAAWETNLATGKKLWDDRMARLLGVAAQGAQRYSDRWLEFVHPEDRDRVTHDFMTAVRTGGRFDCEFRSRGLDGSVKWLSSCGELMPTAEPAQRRIVGLVQDISERKQTELRLARERAILDAVLAAAPIGFALFDPDLRFVLINERLAEMNGLPVAAHLGKTVREIVPNLESQARDVVDRVLSSGQPVLGHEFQGTTPSAPGVLRYWSESWYPVANSGEGVIGVAVVVEEVTERKRAEAELRRSEQRFREMADTAPAMLWVTDRENKLEFISKGWFEYTGQEEADAYREGLGWTLMVHPEDRDDATQAFLNAADGREAFELHYRLRRADGSYRWSIDAGRPRLDEDGSWLGYIGSVIDIHEQRTSLDALREADQRKDEFLATLAHELRNPLAPIRNALHLLTLAGGAGKVERIHEMLERQVGQMVRLVDDLMEASRISRGQLVLKQESLDLRDVVRQAVETSRPLIDRARHVIDVQLPEQELPVVGDSVRLGQIFANLLNNAAKYTDDGGKIEVRVRRAGHAVVLTVQDSGLGLAAEQLPRLFEMFSQVDSSAARRHGGLGIGLALAKRLTEMHGGTIEAASEGLGCGSSFSVLLPIATASRAAAVKPTPPNPLHARRMLVVDDNKDSADSLGMLLRFLGAEVRVEHSGKAALLTAAAWRPSVMLLDLGMPGLDGFEVARRLRANPDLAYLKLIALTGWGQEEDRRRTRASGFDHHLIKPVDLNVLHTLLASLQGEQTAS